MSKKKKRDYKKIFKTIGVIFVSLIWVSIFVYGSGYATGFLPLDLIWQAMVAGLVTFALYMVLESVCVNLFECSKYVYMISTLLFAFPAIMLTGPFFSVIFKLGSVEEINQLISKGILIYSILVPSRVIFVLVEMVVGRRKNKHKF